MSASDAQSLLERLAVPAEDAAAIVATLPDRARHPVRWWMVARASQLLTPGLSSGRRSPLGWWPAWPSLPGEAGRWFYAHVCLAATPAVRRWHASRGVDDTISWDTLSDLGRGIEAYRLAHPGRSGGGLNDPGWLVHHYRGELFQLGRLQFLRGHPPMEGRKVLDIHIPTGGPLTPAAVDASFVQAREFFAEHFPAASTSYGFCQSWILDPQLADHLPAESNIVAFQRRFRLIPGWQRRGDTSIRAAAFHRRGGRLADLPQDTTLRQAVVTHLRNGRHWRIRRGWCELDA